MIVGVLAGLATGALWGLTFIAPRDVAPFSALDLTIARYCVFGLVSAGLMVLDRRFRLKREHMTPRLIGTGLTLGALGYVAYFVSIAYAVQLAGPAIPPLVIGVLPVVLGLIGNWRDRTLPWRTLALPLTLTTLGLLVVNLGTLLGSADLSIRRDVLLGSLWAFVALAVWVWYAIVNAGVSREINAPGALPWTGLQGIGAALGSLPLLPLSTWVAGEPSLPLDSAAGGRFLVWAAVLGLAGSWLATWFWVIASQRLSLALAAQLIVAESVFGLLYGFLYETRWPSLAEGLGAVLQIAGVVMAIRLFQRQARIKEHDVRS